MGKKKVLSFWGMLVSLSLVGTATAPAFATVDDFRELTTGHAQVEILQVEDHFEFVDTSSGTTMEAIREVGDRANSMALMSTAEGVPVVAHQASSLPVKDDGLEFLEAASQRAQQMGDAPSGHVEEPEGSGFKGFTAEETAFDENQLRPRAAFAVSPTGVTFRIEEKAGLRTPLNFHTVVVNDKEYGVFDDDQFSVEGLEPENTYRVAVTSTGMAPAGDVEGDSGTTLFMVIETPPVTMKAAAESSIATMAAVTYTQAYDHTTFIPASRIELTNPIWKAGCGTLPTDKLEFSGDGRSHAVPPWNNPSARNAHRTAAFININFDSPLPYRIYTDKSVGATSKYVNGGYVGTNTASSGGIVFTSPSSSSTYAQVGIAHEVTNPWCSGGAITYSDTVDFYRTINTIEVNGWRWQVPAHEISMRFDTTSMPGVYWVPAWWAGLLSFDCLAGTAFCSPQSYSALKVG